MNSLKIENDSPDAFIYIWYINTKTMTCGGYVLHMTNEPIPFIFDQLTPLFYFDLLAFSDRLQLNEHT